MATLNILLWRTTAANKIYWAGTTNMHLRLKRFYLVLLFMIFLLSNSEGHRRRHERMNKKVPWLTKTMLQNDGLLLNISPMEDDSEKTKDSEISDIERMYF